MEYITLSQLQKKIRYALEENVRDCWIVAEINELNVNNSGHCYINFVEKGKENHIPRAKIGGVIWRSSFPLINGYFREATGSPLAAGMQVLVLGAVIYHELYGISLHIKEIDPAYTLGDMERQRQECIRRLKADGIHDMNKELSYPTVLERIAVISSDKAAGYQDFINELDGNEYGYQFATTLFSAFMQGAEAESSIINALNSIADRFDDFDAVILIRGGGSQSDLGCFDSYSLCSNLAQFPLPVITGIGHNKDVSVADMVAHDNLKTPTAVARFLIDQMLDFENQLDGYLEFIRTTGQNLLQNSKSQLNQLTQLLQIKTREHIHREELVLSRRNSEIFSLAQMTLKMAERTALEQSNELKKRCKQLLVLGNEKINGKQKEIIAKSRLLCVENRNRIELLDSTLKGYDPARILKMGYSITTVKGKAVNKIKDVTIGESMEIRMSDGILIGKITEKTKI